MKNHNVRSNNRNVKFTVLLPMLVWAASQQTGVAQKQQAQAAPSNLAAMVAVNGAPGNNVSAASVGSAGATAAAPAAAASVISSGYTLSHAAGSEPVMHLVVGQSMFVNTRARLRRVYVANSAVLDSFTADPNQIIVTAKIPGVSTLVLWDEAGLSKSYLISADINVEALQAAFKQTAPTEKIQVEGNEGRVILKGTVSSALIAENAVKLAGFYAKDVASSLVVNPSDIKQVRLKVRILEVDRSRLQQFGINLLGAGGSTIGSSTTSQFPVSTSLTTTGSGGSTSGGYSVGGSTFQVSDPLNFLLYSSKINVGVTVKDLENKQVLQILAEPTITTLSGEKANFLAGGEFPFPVVQGGSGGLNSVSVQFRPYGVKVEFTPFVNADGTIDLKVAPEVSALDYANAAVISGYTIPALATRRAETQVVLKSGQSFAISGLLDRRTTDALGRTPGIASIPILGQLFRSKSINHTVNELIVIVTPTIVDPLSEDVLPEEPKLAIPTLQPQGFDKLLPKSLTQK